MTRAVAAVWLIACGGPQVAPSPPEPPAPTCEAAVANELDVIDKHPPPGQQLHATVMKLKPIMLASCREDHWSDTMRTCAMSDKIEVISQCGDELSSGQKAQIDARITEARRADCDAAIARSAEHERATSDPNDQEHAAKMRTLQAVLAQSCLVDKWQQDAVDCMLQAANSDADTACQKLMTPEQVKRTLERINTTFAK